MTTIPKYWITYEYQYVNDTYEPETLWKTNIDWISANLRTYGYNMVCTDGWIEGSTRHTINGYVTHHNDSWTGTWNYWSNYAVSLGMTLGIYYNPLWITPAAVNNVNAGVYDQNNVWRSIASLVNSNDKFGGNAASPLYWVDVDKPGAEQFVKGYVNFFKTQGAKFLRVDFLSWYESAGFGNPVSIGHTIDQYNKALKWMSEASGTDMVLSLVMPNLYNHGATEIKYGNMVRIDEDCFGGGWDHVSSRRRGVKQDGWSQWANMFDGFTGFSDITGTQRMMPDGDFIRMNTFSNDAERRSVISVVVMAGSPIAIADQSSTIGSNIWAYQNSELLAFSTAGLIGKPLNGDSQRWAGQLPDGSWAVGLFNRESSTQIRNIDFLGDLGITSACRIRDIWAHTDINPTSTPFGTSYSASIGAHDCKILKVTPLTSHIKYQTEFASVKGRNYNHIGDVGMGFADKMEETTASIIYAVSVPTTGTYSLTFRYSNCSTSSKTLSLYLNGTSSSQITFAQTPTWDTWNYVSANLALTTGITNVVKLQKNTTDSGRVNVDYMQYTLATLLNTATYKTLSANTYTGSYVAGNANDGNQATYWQSNGFPGILTCDLGTYHTISKITLKLPSGWGSRTQNITVLGSINGSTYTNIKSATVYTFSGTNIVNITFTAVEYRYIRLSVSSNSGASGAQISEFEIYENTTVRHETELVAITNGGFENGDITGWTEWHPAGQNIAYGVDSPDAYEGSKKLYFYAGTAYQQSVHQIKTGLTNGRYTVKAWIKQTAYGGQPSTSRMELQSYGGSASYIDIITENSGYSTYKEYSGSVIVTNGQLDIGFYTNSPGSTSVQIDSVTLAKNNVLTAARTLSSITSAPSSITVGLKLASPIVITANYSDGKTYDVTELCSYTSSNTTIATVDAVGGIYGVLAGTATITSSFSGANVNVSATVASSVTATAATTRSITSFYLSNWQNSMFLWFASKLSQTDPGGYQGGNGPRIGEVRYGGNMTVNLIKDLIGVFRNDSTGVKYNTAGNFNSSAFYDENGVLNTTYLDYSGTNMPLTVTKNYTFVPNQAFAVYKYTFTNPTGSAINYNLLEQLHENNTNTSINHHAWYDATRKTLFIDQTATGQFVLALKAFDVPTGYQAANDVISDINNQYCSGWVTFDNNGTLKNNADVYAGDISVAFQSSFSVPANNSVSKYFLLAVSDTVANLTTAINTANAQTAEYWFVNAASQYTTWAAGKKSVTTADNGINLMYKRALVTIKNTINPLTGAIPATTNPIAYSYKVWARDSAVTALILNKAGYTAEAQQYWYWLKNQVRVDGTIGTTFNLWDSSWISFVEPEHDSLGIFIQGVYEHYKTTGSSTFLDDMWDKVKAIADFISNNMSSYGLGPADHSIWEESALEYNSFTQATYVNGLDAASYIAKIKNDATRCTNYAGCASVIRSNIQKSIWNGSYFSRALNLNGSQRLLTDNSASALIVLGVVDALSSRAKTHISTMKSSLQHDNFGMARYTADNYYYNSGYEPAGDEALSNEPSWPQMSLYTALHHIYRGEKAKAMDYLKWCVSRTAVGYMAEGECVSRINMLPVISTAVQPVTGAWFVGTMLTYDGQVDFRQFPLIANAGMQKEISIFGPSGYDMYPFESIPYFSNVKGNASQSSTDIVKCYISNDNINLYVRLSNAAGSLPDPSGNKYGVVIYSEDFKHIATTFKSQGLYTVSPLNNDMNYAVEFKSDSTVITKYNVVGTTWTSSSTLDVSYVMKPSITTGDIEITLPLSTLSSTGIVSLNDWGRLNITLTKKDPATSIWSQDDLSAINYRFTVSETPLYGSL